jgi:hypothetical protein
MDIGFRQTFLTRWHKHFGNSELPITFEYTDDERDAEPVHADSGWHCFIARLKAVRESGKSLSFSAKSFHCAGGRYYTGFAPRLRSNIAEFLSCDASGEGERYKKNSEIAAAAINSVPWHEAPASMLVFKRWDKLDERDHPHAVIFFAPPDVLAGLFTLASYEEGDLQGGMIAPFGSGCASIVQYPFAESRSNHPRAVMGMFDVSARPHVPAGTLTFAIPMGKFERMVANMDESFLITESWQEVLRRLKVNP